jgi:acyl carrier protein
MADLRHEIRSYIIENYLFGQEDDLQDTDSFWELGLMDSTGVLELISHLEEKYSISLESTEIIPDNLDSIEKLTRFVASKIRQELPAAEEALVDSPGASR